MTTATLTLAAFLEARLAEDEAVARAAAEEVGFVTGSLRQKAPVFSWSVIQEPYEGISVWEAPPSGPDRTNATTTHIARHDPARVLAEVAAKRAIIEAHSDERAYLGCFHDPQGDDLEMGEYNSWHDDHDCPTLRALASVYKDHPEWREEWL